MSFPIVYTSEALQEEAEAFLFYEQQSAGLGDRFLNEVEETLYRIAKNPNYYTFIDSTKTIRDLALNKFPFVIIFEVKQVHIIVYHIHHTRRELK